VTRLAALACVLVAGCALFTPSPKERPLRPGEIHSAQGAGNAIAVGKSTKADVRAALGEATVIDFDSGYEVWVYRERLKEKAKPPPTELVLLFPPSGVLAKARVR
jgi:hypothetical protein